MFLRLWRKECTQIGKSLIYWLYIIALVLFFTSQLGNLGGTMIQEPKQGQESYGQYGYKSSEDENDIMRAALGNLVSGYYYKHFTTYPVGYAKNITLSDEEWGQIADIVEKTTGMTDSDIEQDITEHYETYNPETNYAPYTAEPKATLTYDEFLNYMKQVEKMLGAGSDFSEAAMKNSVELPMDYEGAKFMTTLWRKTDLREDMRDFSAITWGF